MTSLSSTPATQPLEIRRLAFHGTGGSLFGTHVTNAFLTLVTLGVYYFWAKVNVRRYLYGSTEVDGDRFAYHGTGKELAAGLARAVVLFGIPLLALKILPGVLGAPEQVQSVTAMLAYGIVLVAIPAVKVGSRRYRLSRTSWRGIRFSFRGSTKDFIKLYLFGWLLSGLLGGLYYPFFLVHQHRFMVSNSYFGNRKFEFDGAASGLFRHFLVALLMTLPTLGLCWYWFVAAKQRFLWSHTCIGAARFQSTVTGARRLGLGLGDAVLILVTLGLAWPWVAARDARFVCRYLVLEGPLDLAAIQQEAQVALATGEELAGFLDLDVDFGA